MPDQGSHSRLPSGRNFRRTEPSSFAGLGREYRRYRTTTNLQASRARLPWLPLLPATGQATIPACLRPSPGGISCTGTRRGARIMRPENRSGSWPPFLPTNISDHLGDGMSRPDTGCTAPCRKAELVKPDSLSEKITRYKQRRIVRAIGETQAASPRKGEKQDQYS